MKVRNNFNRLIDLYFDFMSKYRWSIFFVMLIGIFALSSGVRFLRINGDMNVYFEKSNPQMKGLNLIHEEYEKTDNLILVIAPKDHNVFTKKTLSFVKAITDSAWFAPFVSRVDGLTNYQNVKSSEDGIVIQDLVSSPMELSANDLMEIRKLALGDSILLKRLVSPQGHVAGIVLTVDFPKKDFVGEGPKLISHINNLLKKHQDPDIEVYLTGTVMVDNAFAESGAQDMSTLIPIMIFLIVLFVYLFNRSWISTLSCLFIVLFSAIVSMGIIGFMDVQVTSSLTSGPIMIMTIVIADGIHFFTSVVLAMRSGLQKEAAIKESIRLNFIPLFLTTISTVLGYLTMNLSDSPPFRDLGNLVAIGAFVGYILSFVWLPCLLLILPWGKNMAKAKVRVFDLSFIGVFVTKKWKFILVGTLASTLLIAPFISKNKLNDMFLDFFSDSLKIKKDTQFTVDNLTGIYSIEYSLGAGGSNQVTNLKYLQKLEEFEKWFKKQDKVIQVSSFTETIKKLNMVMHNDSIQYYCLPKDEAMASQYLLLYEMSLPNGQNLTNQINLDKSATRFRVTFKNMYTEDLRKIELAGNEWLKKNAPSFMYFDGTSTSVMFRYLSERNIRFMIEGFLLGIITIVLCIIFATKSLKTGLITILPNVLPSVIAFGFWGVFVGKVGLAVAFVTSFTLGIVVDNSIHFLTKYNMLKREMNLSPEEATIKTFEIAGSSMFVSTIILVIGFLVLMFSPFQLNSNMGILSAITLALSLVYDFLLTPSLVLLLEKISAKRKKQNITNPETNLYAHN